MKTADTERYMGCGVRLHMTVISHKVRRNGKEYYELIDVKGVKGETV